MSETQTFNDHPNYYAIIPAHVRYCSDIEMGAKLLYGEITALSNIQGYCWATNHYFADLYRIDERTVKRWIHSLKENGFITVDQGDNLRKIPRKIWASKEVKKLFTGGQKCPGGGTKMSSNTLSINSTLSITSKKEQKDATSADASALASFLFKKIKEKKEDFSQNITVKWLKSADKLLKIRSMDQLKELISFVMDHPFWFSKVLSTEKILRHLDALEVEMASTPRDTPWMKENRAYAEEIKKKHTLWAYKMKIGPIDIDNPHQENASIGVVPLDIDPEQFKRALWRAFNGTYTSEPKPINKIQLSIDQAMAEREGK